jgi:hypothetical protein
MLSHNYLLKIRLRLGALVITTALLVTSCAGSLFKVKPAIELPPMAADAKSASAGGVTVRVAPLLTDEESQELFEANLPLGGILPVRLELAFESGVPLETKGVRFHLRDGEGHAWKTVSAKTAISRILKANDISSYNPSSRKQFEKEFVAYGINLKSPLTSSDRSHQGFVFFETPNKRPVESPRGLILSIEGLPEPVEIQLTGR